jgi:hypothetical protein
MNELHTTQGYFSAILISSTHLRLGFLSGLFPFGLPTEDLYQFHFSPIRTKYLAHLIPFFLIVLIILGEE